MYKFDITKKGYDTEQVDKYIANEVDCYKQALQEKNIRLQELLHTNSDLTKQLEEYKMRESNVNKALITAIEKAKEMEIFCKQNFKAELENLRIWKNKWITYVNNLKNDCKISDKKGQVIGVLASFEQELIDKIQEGVNLQIEQTLSEPEQQYNSEIERINKINANFDDSQRSEKDIDEEIEKIFANPEFNQLIKSLGIA